MHILNSSIPFVRIFNTNFKKNKLRAFDVFEMQPEMLKYRYFRPRAFFCLKIIDPPARVIKYPEQLLIQYCIITQNSNSLSISLSKKGEALVYTPSDSIFATITIRWKIIDGSFLMLTALEIPGPSPIQVPTRPSVAHLTDRMGCVLSMWYGRKRNYNHAT